MAQKSEPTIASVIEDQNAENKREAIKYVAKTVTLHVVIPVALTVAAVVIAKRLDKTPAITA